jgi:hypothetical protein
MTGSDAASATLEFRNSAAVPGKSQINPVNIVIDMKDLSCRCEALPHLFVAGT